MSSRFDTDETKKFKKQGQGISWRTQIYNKDIADKDTIIDALVKQKKEQIVNRGKPKTIIMNTSDEIKTGSDRQLYWNKDTHVVKPSGVGTREHARIRKQVLKEEGYNVE